MSKPTNFTTDRKVKIDRVTSNFEEATGWPEFARPAFEIREAFVKSGVWQPRDRRASEQNPGRVFAEKYLSQFDRRFEWELSQEMRLWNESMLTTQLNLPYTVIRAIIDEAFPQLVSAQVFDAAVVDANPARIFYEAYFEAESGYEVTVTNEDVTSDEDAWVDLAGAHIQYGTVNVEDDGGGTPYVEGTDFIVDYLEGRIMVLSSGSIGDATALDIDYVYANVRKGENAGIERGRSGLRFVDLPLTADRLASEISDETIKFSRASVGYDAVLRTLNLLAKELMRNIDSALFSTALSEVLRVPNNGGGTWNSASDPLTDLIAKIGIAKVKVENRNYTPTFVLMSNTNADRLANSDIFSNAGSRPDAAMAQGGYAGMLKSLPVYRSSVFPDAYILIGNSQLVHFRTFGDMELRGPFPTYDADRKLVANEQYFVQEYNGRVTPIKEKGAYVIVA